ncbi:MAG: OmpA family protein [Pseudomonadota bacterium]
MSLTDAPAPFATPAPSRPLPGRRLAGAFALGLIAALAADAASAQSSDPAKPGMTREEIIQRWNAQAKKTNPAPETPATEMRTRGFRLADVEPTGETPAPSGSADVTAAEPAAGTAAANALPDNDLTAPTEGFTTLTTPTLRSTARRSAALPAETQAFPDTSTVTGLGGQTQAPAAVTLPVAAPAETPAATTTEPAAATVAAAPAAVPAAAPAEPAVYDRDITVDMQITFEVDSAVIAPSARGVLATLCEAMSAAPADWRFNIIGHADASGDDDYNRTLSETRAREVARRLTADCGIAPTRLVVYGLGESRLLPGVPPVSEANRRVEVSLAES